MTTTTQGEHAQTALEDFEVRKLASIGAVSTSSGLVERRPIEYRRELENQFVRGYRAAESRLHAQVAALTAAPSVSDGLRTLHDAILNRLSHAELLEKAHYLMELNSNQARTIGELQDLVEAATAQPAAPQDVAYAELPDSSTKGEWFVRKLEKDGELKDCFVAAPDCTGCAYDAEILGDDEYRGDMVRKLADCELIVNAVKHYRASNGQAPAGATPDSDAMDEARSNVFDSVIEDLQERVERTNYPGNEIYILALREAIAAIRAAQPSPTAQAAPAAGTVAVPRETLVAWRQWCAQSMSHAIEHEISDWLTAAPTPAAQADSGCYDYAKRLATSLWGKHYKEAAPLWEVCEDLMGVLTQIDNMVSGLTSAQADSQPAPIDMVLHCPSCFLQHIDAPDERTPDWKNEPHRSHLCHGCGHIWRPADVPTNGVAAVKTTGKADSPTPAAQADSQPAIAKRSPISAYPPLPDLVSSVWPFIHTNAAADSAAMVAKTSDQVDDAIHTLLRAYVDADRAARKQGGA